MAAVADTYAGGDPLVARQATVSLAVHELVGGAGDAAAPSLWSVVDAGFSRVATLPRTEWTPPGASTSYVIPELHAAPLPSAHPALSGACSRRRCARSRRPLRSSRTVR